MDIDESERRLARVCLRYAKARNLPKKVAEIQSLGPPPYMTMAKQERAMDLSISLFPAVAHQVTPWNLMKLALGSRYYPFHALVKITNSYQFSRDLLAPQLHGYDLRRLVPEIDVPILLYHWPAGLHSRRLDSTRVLPPSGGSAREAFLAVPKLDALAAL